jgi:hypothetical protein
MKQEHISLRQAAEHWQRCPHEELPRAFYAYNTDLQQSERVVSYRLDDPHAVAALTGRAEKAGEFEFAIHLGLSRKRARRAIPNTPAFQLFIQVLTGQGDDPESCYPLRWVPDSQFGKRNALRVESGPNAIPGASAYLFTQAWRELPYDQLAEPFTGSIRELGRRVKTYTHPTTVSRSIHADLLGRGNGHLTVHLGTGLAVWDHPFGFRPVVEIGGSVGEKQQLRSSRLEDDGAMGEESYYDFGSPNPPGDH